jgi:hypothetical protein
MHTTFVADLRHLSHDCRIRHLLVDTLQIIRRLDCLTKLFAVIRKGCCRRI